MGKLHKKIVLTGACGSLGMQIRRTLAALAEELVSVDIAEPPADLLDNETFVQADCSKLPEVRPLAKGADMIVHFASIADERPFRELLGPNFLSSYNVWEAAHLHKVKRVIYASSIHAVGMVETAAGPDLDMDHAPDTFYGLAKCFAEDLGKLYWAKRGLESVHLRIASCTEAPENARALQTWLSFDDLRHLVERAVLARTTGFTVIYGVSNNDRSPVNNARAAHLGYHPKDNAEDWAEQLLADAPPADPSDRAQMCLGGPFATVKLGQSGVAGIKAMGAKSEAPEDDSQDQPGEPAPQVSPEPQPAVDLKPVTSDAKKLPSFLTKRGMNP